MIDMNKLDIINALKKYNLDKNEYIVISGAAMVLYGIKEETGDIDIAVSQNYYSYLLNNYDCIFKKVNEYGNKVYIIDNIIDFSTTYYKEEKVYVNAIPLQSLKDILKLKLNLNREKDKIDIEKIKEFLNE